MIIAGFQGIATICLILLISKDLKLGKSIHISLDLHGKTHSEAKILIDEFIIQNSESLPLEVITGNSTDMHKVLKAVVKNHNFKLIPSNSFNMGSYLIVMPLYIKDE